MKNAKRLSRKGWALLYGRHRRMYVPTAISITHHTSTGLNLHCDLGQFTRNYTQTVKRAADNKRRYAPGEGSIPPVLLSGVSKGVPPLAHDFACKV